MLEGIFSGWQKESGVAGNITTRMRPVIIFSVQGTATDGPTREQRDYVPRKRRGGGRRREGRKEQASRAGVVAFVQKDS